MTRIILEPLPGQGDLADGFVKALNLLRDGGFKARAGTKLLSRYAVIVVEAAAGAAALANLQAGHVAASVEPLSVKELGFPKDVARLT
ncbi:MAG: hypothetical protein ACLQAT_24725 [Candidatus Binataceae bacterium]